jgi:hypothetical protein
MQWLKKYFQNYFNKSKFLNNISVAALNSILLSILTNVIVNIGSNLSILVLSFLFIIVVNILFTNYLILKSDTEEGALIQISAGDKGNKYTETQIDAIYSQFYKKEKTKSRMFLGGAVLLTLLSMGLLIYSNDGKNNKQNKLESNIDTLKCKILAIDSINKNISSNIDTLKIKILKKDSINRNVSPKKTLLNMKESSNNKKKSALKKAYH